MTTLNLARNKDDAVEALSPEDANDPLFAPTPKPEPISVTETAELQSADDSRIEPSLDGFVDDIVGDQKVSMEQVSAQVMADAHGISREGNATQVIAESDLTPDGAEELPSDVDEVIAVQVFSRDGGVFRGEELLHILLACDCRFGKMNIFHRYEEADAKGPVQFSVANAVEPGFFDLENIKSFSTPGVTFFLQLPGPKETVTAYDYMIETAQCVAKNLNGDLLDESRNLMRSQTIEHGRERVLAYEKKRLLNKA